MHGQAKICLILFMRMANLGMAARSIRISRKKEYKNGCNRDPKTVSIEPAAPRRIGNFAGVALTICSHDHIDVEEFSFKVDTPYDERQEQANR